METRGRRRAREEEERRQQEDVFLLSGPSSSQSSFYEHNFPKKVLKIEAKRGFLHSCKEMIGRVAWKENMNRVVQIILSAIFVVGFDSSKKTTLYNKGLELCNARLRICEGTLHSASVKAALSAVENEEKDKATRKDLHDLHLKLAETEFVHLTCQESLTKLQMTKLGK
jgi:hypothetical protein